MKNNAILIFGFFVMLCGFVNTNHYEAKQSQIKAIADSIAITRISKTVITNIVYQKDSIDSNDAASNLWGDTLTIANLSEMPVSKNMVITVPLNEANRATIDYLIAGIARATADTSNRDIQIKIEQPKAKKRWFSKG